MFKNFEYEHFPERLIGYIWEVDSPKKVLCIIHGVGEHAGRYDRLAGYMMEKDIAVISMDLPGHGLSYGERGHTPRNEALAAVDEMISFAEARYPGIPIVLYGHSMGGNICLDYRARGNKNDVPEKYAISAPWIRLTKKVPKPLYLGLKALSKSRPTMAISTGCKPEILGNMEHTGNYSTDPLVHINISLQTSAECFEIGEAIALGKNESNGRASGKPFLLMHGSDDKICDVKGSRMVAARMSDDSNFKYIEWPGYYHEIHNGGPEATGEEPIIALRDFILE